MSQRSESTQSCPICERRCLSGEVSRNFPVLDISMESSTSEETTIHQKGSSFLDHYLLPRCLIHNQAYLFADLSDSSSTSSNRLLCADCINEECSQLLRLGKSSTSFTESKCEYLRDQTPNLSHLLSELREEEQSLGSRMIRLSESKSQALSDLRQRFEGSRKALSAREEALERELEEVYKCCLFELEDGRERSRIWQGQLSVLLGCVAELERVLPSFHRREKRINQTDIVLREFTPEEIFAFENPPPPPPDLVRTVKNVVIENELNHSSLGLRKRPLSSEVSDFTINTDLAAKICLLEDAVRNAITSLSFSNSPHTYSSTSADQISLSFDWLGHETDESSDLESVLSVFGAVTSSSSRFVPVDWSVNNLQKIFTTSQDGADFIYSLSDSKLIFAERFWDVNRLVSIEQSPDPQHRTHSYHGPLKLNFSAIVSNYPNEISPNRMCLSRGLLYILDSSSRSILVWREKDASFVGHIGSSGNLFGQFQYPSGCIVYKDELYVSDLLSHRIQVFSLPNGEYLREFGYLGSGKGELNHPNCLQVYQDRLFVVERSNNRVSVFNPSTGAFLFHIGPNLPPQLSLDDPQSLLIYKDFLFVSQLRKIFVFTCEGKYLYSFGEKDGFYGISGMAMFKDRLFVTDANHLQISVYEQK